MLVFVAADRQRLEELVQATAEYLAWKSMADEKVVLNLTPFQQGQVDTKLRHADETVGLRLAEAYHWLLVPVQPESTSPMDLEVVRLNGAGTVAARASTKLVRDNHLNTVYTPVLLRLQLDRVPLWPDGHMRISELWESLARYLYLPRLKDRSVLERAAVEGPGQLLWEMEGFALADGYDEGTRRYLGLVCGGSAGRPVSAVTGTTLVIKPEIAILQAKADAASTTEAEPFGVSEVELEMVRDGEPSDPALNPVVRLRRFHGTARLDAQRLNRDVARLTQEVVEHLTGLVGTDVEVSVEIQATNEDGFPDDVVRTVSENARTLHLLSHGFEER
jgi:hypothetical protein